MSKTAGRVKVTINGRFIDTFKGVKFNPGGVKRNEVVSAHSVNYSEEIMPARLEFEKTQRAKDSIKDLDLADARIQVEFDTGQSYVMTGAFRVDPAEITDDGKSAFVFVSDPALEIM